MNRLLLGLLSCFALASGACGDDGGTERSMDPATEADCPCRLATKFDNLALCVSPSTALAPAHVYSTSWNASTMLRTCEPYRDPQPVPTAPWTGVKVSSDCAGSGQLCMAVRAGNAASLSADDCTLAMVCSDIAYTTPQQIVELTPFSGWTAQSSECANRQAAVGAYLELSLQSDTLGCGMGLEQLTRIPVCPARCQDNPAAAGCEICSNGAITTTL